MTKAEQFCSLNGIHCHTGTIYQEPNGNRRFGCSLCGSTEINPTFTDAKSILEVMMDRNDSSEFIDSLQYWNIEAFINIYILNPDKLLDVAIKFCEENALIQ